jgi:hypothetical protein
MSVFLYTKTYRGAAVVFLLMLNFNPLRAGQTVVDAGTTFTFSVPAIAANYAWRLDGTLVSSNGVVGTNGPNFTYAPTRFDVGTHVLACFQTLSNGVASNTFWQVRVRIPLPTPATSFYIATNGSDANAGTLAAPFLTLERARTAVSTNAARTNGGVTVYLRGGTYFRTNTFVLTNADSGTLASPVIYAGYPGETVVISAGTRIPAASWTPLNSSQTNRVSSGVNPTNILELDLKTAGITHTNIFPAHFNTWVTTNIYQSSGSGGICDLFYNGKRQWLSRFPNHDLMNDNLNTPFMLMDGVAASGSGSTNYLNGAGTYTNSAGQAIPVGGAFHYYSSNDTEVAKWATAFTNGGVWVSGFWRVEWQNDAIQVLGIDTTNRVIEITNTASVGLGIGDKYSRPQGNFAEPFWVMNLLEDMDQPGEWCLDFKRNKLYFYAPTNQLADGSVVISDFAAPLVQLTQTTNVVFRSLVFEDGLAQGILIGTNCQNNLVVGCTLRNMNNYPVDINGGYTNGVVSCLMQDLAGGGVFLRGGNENSSPRVPACDFVVNNIITNSGVIARIYASPIDAGFAGSISGSGGGGHTQCVGMRVAHNLMTVAPHVGILHGSWDNTFEYNDLGFDGQTWNGISVIYSYDLFGRCGNDSIRYNFIHDSAQEGALGFDGDHWNEHIYGNLANQTPAGLGEGDGATQKTPGHEQPVEFYNNLTVNNTQVYGGIGVSTPLPCTLEENAAIFCSTPYPVSLVTAGVTTNTITASTIALLQSGPNMTYTNDPGFINLANNDLRLVPNSTVYTDMPKFAQIPFEMIGLYNDETWSNAPGYSPYIVTTNATSVTSSNAVANGWLYYPQFDSNTTVIVYFGTSDGGSNALAWQSSTNLGVVNPSPVGGIIGPLTNGTKYFFRCFATNAFGSMWSPASITLRTAPSPTAPVPAITNLTSNLVAMQNSTLTLTGKIVYLTGPIYASVGDPVSVTIGGVTQTGAVTDATGNFSVSFNTFGIPPSGTPYTITYIYAGSTNLNIATNITKTVTLNPLQQPVISVANAAVVSGKTAVLTGQISSTGPLYPANGETVGVTINGSTQYGTVTNAMGNFLIFFDASGFAISTTPYPATYFYAGDTNLNSATNSATTLSVCPPNFFWTGTISTNFETGGLGGNWSNYAAPVSDLFSATAIFSNTPTANQPSLTASRSVAGLLFTTTNGGWTLGAGSPANLLAVGLGGISTVGQISGTNRILACLDLGFGQTWQVATGGTLLLTGGITNSVRAATNYSLTINAGGMTGNIIFSPAGNSSVNLDGPNNGGSILQVKAGGVLQLGGDGTNAPLTVSTNKIFTASTNSYSTLALNAPAKVKVNSGTWILSDLGQNGNDRFTGTLEVNGGVVSFGGARYLGEGTVQMNGGTVRVGVDASTHYVNGQRFSLGSTATDPANVATMNLVSGFVDLAAGAGNTIGAQIDTLFNQSGGTNQNGVTPGVNGGSSTTFTIGGTGSGTNNNLTAYTLTGGIFASAGAVQGATVPGPGSANNFNFMGGTLSVQSFNATYLGSSPTATAAANQTNVSLAIGTLANYGGTLAPGYLGFPGKTTITGNYAVSNSAATLAIDLGGTTQATAFTNALNSYDYVSASGTAALGGSLKVNLINNFSNSIAATNSFIILTAGSLSGAFTNVTGGRVPVANYSGGSFQVVTTATSVVLTNFSVPVSAPPILNGVILSGTNLIFSGTNGSFGANYLILTTTNLALPISNWSILSTNQFGNGGAVNFTNPLNPNSPQLFYRLRLP